MTIEDPMLRVRYIETRTGIKIGSAYTPPAKPAGTEALAIQQALLDPATAKPLSFAQRLLRRIYRWL